jgi:hypothetical protein
MPKDKTTKERRKYCHCTPICTSKTTRTIRLRHYRKAKIPFEEAPPSVTGTESGDEGPKPTVIDHDVRDPSPADKEMDDGYLGTGSKYEDDQMDGLGQEAVNSQDELEQEYEEPRVDIAEEFAEGTTLEDGNLEEEDSEFDEWKEFDEEAEAGWFDNLSESDRLSELDDADAYEAEGWQNRLYFFGIQMTRAIRRVFFRKRIFN